MREIITYTDLFKRRKKLYLFYCLLPLILMSELLLLIYKDLATDYDIVMAILVAYAVPLIISLVLFIIHFGSERKLKKQIETFSNQGADIFKGEYILFSGLFITEKYLVSYSFSTKRIICFDQVKYIDNQQSEFEKNVVFVMQDDCDKSLFSYTEKMVYKNKILVDCNFYDAKDRTEIILILIDLLRHRKTFSDIQIAYGIEHVQSEVPFLAVLEIIAFTFLWAYNCIMPSIIVNLICKGTTAVYAMLYLSYGEYIYWIYWMLLVVVAIIMLIKSWKIVGDRLGFNLVSKMVMVYIVFIVLICVAHPGFDKDMVADAKTDYAIVKENGIEKIDKEKLEQYDQINRNYHLLDMAIGIDVSEE